VKIFLSLAFSSSYLSEFFIPFTKYFVSSGLENPYNFFWKNGMTNSFPYPQFMLYTLSLFEYMFNWVPDTYKSLTLLVYRLPLLISDCVILLILLKWLKGHPLKVMLFYWLSPVLIYISYIHGQLDVIPVCLLFISLYALFKDRFLISGLFLGLSLAAKMTGLMAVPFFLVYFYLNKTRKKSCLIFLTTLVVCFVVINIPYASSHYFSMVFQNDQQSKLLHLSLDLMSGRTFYVIFFVYGILLFHSITFVTVNRDVFNMFLGFTFGSILLFIPPAPGWYFWFLPFLIYFCIKNEGKSYIIFFGLQTMYFIYFFIIPESDYFQLLLYSSGWKPSTDTIFSLLEKNNLNPYLIVNTIFTIFQTTLLFSCILIYQRGVQSFRQHKLTFQPYLIGIGGDSGVGKTTFSKIIESIFESKNVTHIKGDDMHKWERGAPEWETVTHLDPKANHLHQEYAYLSSLKKGKAVFRRYYDHTIGKFSDPIKLNPKKILLFDGLHPFYIERLRDLYNLKIFICPEKQLIQHWKIVRDQEKRGYSKEKVLDNLTRREKDSQKYIDVQSKYADILIEIFSEKTIQSIGDESEKLDYKLKLRFSNWIYLDSVINALKKEKNLTINQTHGDTDYQFLTIEGNVEFESLETIAEQFIPGLQDLGINRPIWPKNLFGVLALLVTYYMFLDIKSK
jgi:uridine kinase